MIKYFETCILGGGIPGIYALYKLNENDACLINSSKSLGGITNGFKWKDYKIDFGCRFLDGNKDLFTFFSNVGGAQEITINYSRMW